MLEPFLFFNKYIFFISIHLLQYVCVRVKKERDRESHIEKLGLTHYVSPRLAGIHKRSACLWFLCEHTNLTQPSEPRSGLKRLLIH